MSDFNPKKWLQRSRRNCQAQMCLIMIYRKFQPTITAILFLFYVRQYHFEEHLLKHLNFNSNFCWDFKSCRSQSRKLSLTKPKNRLSSQSNNFLTSFFVAQINLRCHHNIKKYYIKYSLCLHMLFLSPLLISLFKVPSHTWMQKGVVHTM